MSGRYVLDTNIVIALFANDKQVLERLRQADEVFLPCIVLGELHYGARKSSRVESNLEKIEKFASSAVVLPVTTRPRRYGKLKSQLRQKGRPLPENDVWIAAIARQHDLTLVSRDSHFDEVEELPVQAW